MATTAAPPSGPPRLQIAQVLADLTDLRIADPGAALDLLHANKYDDILPSSPSKLDDLTASINSIRRASEVSSSMASPTPTSHIDGVGTRYDKHGRRISPPIRRRTLSPRDSSGYFGSGDPSASDSLANSVLTPLSGQSSRRPSRSPEAVDEDVDLERARTLLRLWEVRGRTGKLETDGLMKSRERVERIREGIEGLMHEQVWTAVTYLKYY